jgi:hypothetical protein
MHTRKGMFHSGKAHSSASPYNYYGRTHDKEAGQMHHVQHHSGGHQLRRSGHPASKRVESWLERGGGHGASRRD